MKKIIIILFCLTIIMLLSHEERITIPKESIRFRIIASSNSEEDQNLKWQINKELIPILVDMTDNSSNIIQMRDNINSNLRDIDKIVNKYSSNYIINFGQNYFPQKVYKNVYYPEGEYESLVVTLGDGLGDNWWCVLFPPLCLMEAKEEEIDDIEYKTYIEEVLNKIF